jgi:hypothetical protein
MALKIAIEHPSSECASDKMASKMDSYFLIESPSPLMEVLRCGVTVELRLMASLVYLTEPTFLGDISFPFSPEYKRWGCGHLSLLTWVGTSAPLQLRFVIQTYFSSLFSVRLLSSRK